MIYQLLLLPRKINVTINANIINKGYLERSLEVAR
jgi:hypothetical protein